jgi:predicted transglutaminase-like cysteine proteinase
MRHQNNKGVTLRDRNARVGLLGILAAFSLLALPLITPATQAQTLAALPSMSQPIGDLGAARPIQGWVRFCETFPRECAVDVSEPAVVEITPQIWKTVVSVNQRVNATIKPITDQDHWGVVDNWGFPIDGRGDCEDFQLLKRRMLVDGGLPRRAMRMTVVIDELGEGHAVLMLRTNQGDYVLDNKTSSILPWEKTGYVFIKRESQSAETWVSLGGITSPTISTPTTTANK